MIYIKIFIFLGGFRIVLVKYSDFSEILICLIYLATEFTDLRAYLVQGTCTKQSGVQTFGFLKPRMHFRGHQPNQRPPASVPPRPSLSGRRATKRPWGERVGMSVQRGDPRSLPSRKCRRSQSQRVSWLGRHVLLSSSPLELWNCLAVVGAVWLAFLSPSFSPPSLPSPLPLFLSSSFPPSFLLLLPSKQVYM